MQILFYEDPRDRCDAKTLDRADAHGLNRIGVEYPGGGEHGSVCKQDGPRAVGIEVADMCRAAQFRWRTGMALPGEIGGGGGERDGKIYGEAGGRSEEHTSELQSLMRISYAVFCLKKKKKK